MLVVPGTLALARTRKRELARRAPQADVIPTPELTRIRGARVTRLPAPALELWRQPHRGRAGVLLDGATHSRFLRDGYDTALIRGRTRKMIDRELAKGGFEWDCSIACDGPGRSGDGASTPKTNKRPLIMQNRRT